MPGRWPAIAPPITASTWARAGELRAAAQSANDALSTLAPRVQRQQSFVTGDKVYCVYIADDERDIHEHAELSGFPANRVSQVAAVLDPASAAT